LRKNRHILILIGSFFLCIGGELRGEWAEKILNEMTFQEKIGQLLIVPACPQFDPEALLEVMETYHIGTVLIKQGHPLVQVPFLNTLQNRSKWPLLCVADAEWGLGMRMEETLSFPKNLTLGAIQNEALLFELGKMLGEQCKLVGIHLNFAPVVDVNNHPHHPIIGMRSFGDDEDAVSRKGALVIRGMQEAGILACAKHFPGHGGVEIDSHHGLPTLSSSRIALKPFKEALTAGVRSLMSGHLLVPKLDGENPASLSYPMMTTLLKEEWGFEGLCITDALNMKALSENYGAEEIAEKALLAGHDLLLYGAHLYNDVEAILKRLIPVAFRAIETAVKEGRISEKLIDEHVYKILLVKEGLGLHQNRYTPLPEDLMERLHSEAACHLRDTLFQEAVTVVNGTLLPAQETGYVKLWEEKSIPSHETLVVALNHSDQIPRLQEICREHPRVIVALFASPYLVRELPPVTTVVGYEWCEAAEKAVWDVIEGKAKGKGELPIAPL